jgi:hypothetical protein
MQFGNLWFRQGESFDDNQNGMKQLFTDEVRTILPGYRAMEAFLDCSFQMVMLLFFPSAFLWDLYRLTCIFVSLLFIH